MDNIDTELFEFLDLLNYTLSSKFIDKWKFKYSEVFLKQFQLKLLNSLSNKKQLKLKTLFKYLTNRCKYSPEQVSNFFKSIEIEMYCPVIYGKISDVL